MKVARRESAVGRVKPVHPYAWIWEVLEREPSFTLRAMFGARAVYLDGKLALAFCARMEPWRGVLVCTERAEQASLRAAFPSLIPHPILTKWLYLAEEVDDFERVAAQLVGLVRRRDPRIGIVPPPKKSSGRKSGPPQAPGRDDSAVRPKKTVVPRSGEKKGTSRESR